MKTEPSERIQQYIKNVDRWPKKAGKADYLRFLSGERLTMARAIKAKCYDCVCGEDTQPCCVLTCALRPLCPYGNGFQSNC